MGEEKKYPSFKQGLGLMLIYLLGQVIIGFIIGFLKGLGLLEASLVEYFLFYYVNPLFAGAIAIYYARNKTEIEWPQFKGELVTNPQSYLWIAIMMGGTFIVNVLGSGLIKLAVPMSQQAINNFYQAYDANIFLVLLGLGFIFPVIEEIIFRGIILRGFLAHYKPWQAIGLSALLFVIIHLNIWQAFTALLTGIVLGWIYFKTRSLLLVIVGHMINNWFSIIVTKAQDIPEPGQVEFLPWWVTIVGILFLIGGIIMFKRYLKNNFAEQKIR